MGQCPLLKQIKLKERKERIAVQPQPYVYAWVRQREMSVLVLKVDDTAFSHLELTSWHTGVCLCLFTCVCGMRSALLSARREADIF